MLKSLKITNIAMTLYSSEVYAGYMKLKLIPKTNSNHYEHFEDTLEAGFLNEKNLDNINSFPDDLEDVSRRDVKSSDSTNSMVISDEVPLIFLQSLVNASVRRGSKDEDIILNI